MSRYAVIDPSTGQLVREYPTTTDAEAAAAVDAAAAAYPAWRATPLEERTAVLRRVAALYRERRDDLAAIITREMGKSAREARGEVELVANIYDYYADNAERMLTPEPIETRGATAALRTDPVGVILGIMPWNYPYYQVARLAAPNLMLGNTIVLKHAPSCPESAEAIAAIFADAELLPGAYVNVRATEDQIAAMIDRPEIQGVSLTGSERAGRAVGQLAGRAMKKAVLELGGSDPFIVLADADLDRAARAAANGRFGNAGQACTASKRIIVVDEVYDAFMSRFQDAVGRIVVGDPNAEETTMGPLSSEAAATRVMEQVDDAVTHGATVVTGGARVDGPGAFIQPTILTDVQPHSRAFHEEIFGPVAVVYRVDGPQAAVDLANSSDFGLGSVIFGTDTDVIDEVADGLDVGMVTVNGPGITSPELPFGGVKASGIGRELGSLGIMEFANRKLVRVVTAR